MGHRGDEDKRPDGAGISWRRRAGRAPIMHLLERQHADTVVDASEPAIAIVERE